MDKEALMLEVLSVMDEISSIMREYDSAQHIYAGYRLYQTEAHMVEQIGNCPGISASELSKTFSKTVSACSQIIKRLRQKGLVTQNRMRENGRIYNLNLTDAGMEVYKDHRRLEAHCFKRDMKKFSDISIREIMYFLKVSGKLHTCFQLDLEEQKRKLQCHNNSLKRV